MTKAPYSHRAAALSFAISIILSVGITAQSPSSTQSQPANLPGVSAAVSDGLKSNRFISPEDSAVSSSHVNVSPEADAPSFIGAPRVGFPHSPAVAKPNAHETKAEKLLLAEPRADAEGAPRNFQATAYNLRGVTASGVYVRQGTIAADPRVLPIGSVVQVKAGKYSGLYTVHDTGPRVKGHTVDIWMPSSREARHFGRRRIRLQVLQYGPSRRVKP